MVPSQEFDYDQQKTSSCSSTRPLMTPKIQINDIEKEDSQGPSPKKPKLPNFKKRYLKKKDTISQNQHFMNPEFYTKKLLNKSDSTASFYNRNFTSHNANGNAGQNAKNAKNQNKNTKNSKKRNHDSRTNFTERISNLSSNLGNFCGSFANNSIRFDSNVTGVTDLSTGGLDMRPSLTSCHEPQSKLADNYSVTHKNINNIENLNSPSHHSHHQQQQNLHTNTTSIIGTSTHLNNSRDIHINSFPRDLHNYDTKNVLKKSKSNYSTSSRNYEIDKRTLNYLGSGSSSHNNSIQMSRQSSAGLHHSNTNQFYLNDNNLSVACTEKSWGNNINIINTIGHNNIISNSGTALSHMQSRPRAKIRKTKTRLDSLRSELNRKKSNFSPRESFFYLFQGTKNNSKQIKNNHPTWWVLVFSLSLYLIIGGWFYCILEQPYHDQMCDSVDQQLIQMQEKLTIPCHVNQTQGTLCISQSFEKLVQEIRSSTAFADANHCTLKNKEPEWSFTQAIFFSAGLITTIGYGNKTPKTEFGKLFTIFYAVFGFCLVGSFISVSSHHIKVFINKTLNLQNLARRQMSRLTRGLIYFVVFVSVFILLPAFLFYLVETKALNNNWSYMTCVYFVIITLSTVGFGDYVPSIGLKYNEDSSKNSNVTTSIIPTSAMLTESKPILSYLYLILTFCWILTGLITMKISLDLIDDSIKFIYTEGNKKFARTISDESYDSWSYF